MPCVFGGVYIAQPGGGGGGGISRITSSTLGVSAPTGPTTDLEFQGGPDVTTAGKVIGFDGNPISAAAPATGQAFVWNGSLFVPTAVAQVPAGDLGGTGPAPTVAKLQGNTLTVPTPSIGDGVRWSGTAWVNNEIGDILGYHQYAPGTADNKSGATGTGFGVLDATNLVCTLTKPVPASGIVLIELTGIASANAVGDGIYWAVETSGNIVGVPSPVITGAADTKPHLASATIVVTGLTAGSLPTFTWLGAATTSSDQMLMCHNPGGTFVTNPAGGGGPATMVVNAG